MIAFLCYMLAFLLLFCGALAESTWVMVGLVTAGIVVGGVGFMVTDEG